MNSEMTSEEAIGEVFSDELKPGTELLHGQYVIEQFLNNGGFGITYLAKDSLDRLVVIKECFPESICSRSNSTVRVRSRNQAEAFRTIVDLFIEEARSLARLSHPNIVGVHQVFEDNDTAYMAMDFVQGRDLMSIADSSENLDPSALILITRKLLDAVEFIHDVGVLHRDIAPDNILLNNENEPVLIDFGAARENVSIATSYLGSMRTVKDGYSPQEFYANNSEQHPSSDLYSLAASLYHVITKELPANAQNRLSAIAGGDDDPYVSIRDLAHGYPEPFLDAIDMALNVFPKDRLQSAAAWRSMIPGPTDRAMSRGSISRPTLAVDNGNLVGAAGQREAAQTSRKVRTVSPKRPRKSSNAKPKEDLMRPAVAGTGSGGKGLYIGVAGAALLIFAAGGAFMMSGGEDPVATPDPTTGTEEIARAAPTESAGEATPPAETRVVEQLPFFLAEPPLAERSRSSDTARRRAAQSSAVSTGTDVVRGRSEDLPETTSVETPSPQDQTLAAVSPSTTTGDVQDIESVITARTFGFPVVPDADNPTIIASSEGSIAEQLAPGLRVVSINGFPIDTLNDFQRVVTATSDPSAGDSIAVTFGLAEPATGKTFVRSVDVPVTHQTMLLNGVSFETVQRDGVWVTTVTNGAGQGEADLRTGDELIAFMPANEMIDGQDALPDMLKREILSGTTLFNFAVKRNGEMWLVSMSYKAAAG